MTPREIFLSALDYYESSSEAYRGKYRFELYEPSTHRRREGMADTLPRALALAVREWEESRWLGVGQLVRRHSTPPVLYRVLY